MKIKTHMGENPTYMYGYFSHIFFDINVIFTHEIIFLISHCVFLRYALGRIKSTKTKVLGGK
jgi:hypothetical protein